MLLDLITRQEIFNILLFTIGVEIGLIAGLLYCVSILKKYNKHLWDRFTELRLKYIELKVKYADSLQENEEEN